MSDQPRHESELFYVAPSEPPPARRPPPGTVGAIGWLRNNLFKGPVNSILTIITFVLVGLFLYEMFRWSIQDAQWSVVINNIKLLNVGQYPSEELWRIEAVGILLIGLSGLGVAIWGGTTRAFLMTIVVVMFLMVLIPIAAERVQPAPIRLFQSGTEETGPMRFVADAGQTIEVQVEPINENENADDENDVRGLVETAPGGQNSRILWSELRRQVNDGEINLSRYSLTIRLQLLNADLEVIEEVVSTPADPNVSIEYEVPEDGWFVARAEVLSDDDEEQAAAPVFAPIGGLNLPVAPNRGHAWVTLRNVEIFDTKPSDIEEREIDYGPMPEVDCYINDPLGCQVAERALRYVGDRSIPDFLRLQISPYVTEVTVPFIVGSLVFLLTYAIGFMAQQSRRDGLLKLVRRIALIGWLLIIPITWIMLAGISGAEDVYPLADLREIPTEQWQGLTLTMILTFISVVASLPLGVMFALGRRSGLPVLGTVSVLFIELIRGAPLITILFFAKNIVPFFFSAGAAQDLGDVIRMLIGLTLFSAAYQAEIVRGGLQIIPTGQTEAAKSLGLNPFYTNVFIILPQALRAVIPATMSQFVSLFKDTSLVSIIGLFELLGIVELIVNGQQQYRPFVREAYLYIGIIYFVIAFIMSAVSRRLEETGSGAARRR